MNGDEERMNTRAMPVAIAIGVSVACLVYGVSLAVQARVPALREMLALDLGPGVRPTYYLCVGVSLTAGFLAGALAGRTLQVGPLVSERLLAWATALLVGAAGLAAVFP